MHAKPDELGRSHSINSIMYFPHGEDKGVLEKFQRSVCLRFLFLGDKNNLLQFTFAIIIVRDRPNKIPMQNIAIRRTNIPLLLDELMGAVAANIPRLYDFRHRTQAINVFFIVASKDEIIMDMLMQTLKYVDTDIPSLWDGNNENRLSTNIPSLRDGSRCGTNAVTIVISIQKWITVGGYALN
jgi:hypothetical protein